MDELNKNESNDVIQSGPKHYLLGTLGALIRSFCCCNSMDINVCLW